MASTLRDELLNVLSSVDQIPKRELFSKFPTLTSKEINSELYTLLKQGKVKKIQDVPPIWALNATPNTNDDFAAQIYEFILEQGAVELKKIAQHFKADKTAINKILYNTLAKQGKVKKIQDVPPVWTAVEDESSSKKLNVTKIQSPRMHVQTVFPARTEPEVSPRTLANRKSSPYVDEQYVPLSSPKGNSPFEFIKTVSPVTDRTVSTPISEDEETVS